MVDNAAAVLLAPEAAAASITAAMLPTRRDSAKAEESRFIRILREKACVIFNMDNPADDD